MPIWAVYPAIAAALLAIPMASMLFRLSATSVDVLEHIVRTVLGRYLFNTALVVTGTTLLTLVLGIPTAWLLSAYRFRGSRFWRLALFLPLALPAYIAAYTYAGIFDYTGPWQRLFRNILGMAPGTYPVVDITNRIGLMLVMASVLSPYVFAVARSSFAGQSRTMLEVGRGLGETPWRLFLRVALPLARPAVVGGSMLVIMEVLNEYGAVHYFGVDTLVTGIFRAWFGMGEPGGAVFLAAVLVSLVLGAVYAERTSRGRARYDWNVALFRPAEQVLLTGRRAITATVICAVPFALGFAIPVAQLVLWAVRTAPSVIDFGFLRLVANTFAAALGTVVVVIPLAVLCVYAARLYRSASLGTGRAHRRRGGTARRAATTGRGNWASRLARFGTAGYVVPGAVVALGIMTFLGWLDQFTFRVAPGLGLFLSGSVVALLFGYSVRYFAVGYNTVESNFEHLCGSLDEAARGLGRPPRSALLSVDVPLLARALAVGASLVFVDVVKELPLTLILRPFNFETLATRAFAYAGNEQVPESAIIALVIVATGLIPVMILNRLAEGRSRAS